MGLGLSVMIDFPLRFMESQWRNGRYQALSPPFVGVTPIRSKADGLSQLSVFDSLQGIQTKLE